MSLPFLIQRKRVSHLLYRVYRKALRTAGLERPVTLKVPSSVNRTIWIYWDQGFADAPPIVQACVQSWKNKNPGWEIKLIDAETFADFCEMPDLSDEISLNHRSDILRLRLLNTHGGVWADATTYCLRPLDEWLPILAQEGFFVFSWIEGDAEMVRTAPPRLLGTWFIAASAGNALIAGWDKAALDYWAERASSETYFWVHDAFEYVLSRNSAARNVWQRMPRLGAAGPHHVWHALERGGDVENARAALASGAIPLQKLSWRMKASVSEIENLVASANPQPSESEAG